MFTFLHSADWQLGSRFPQFRERAEFGNALERIRRARLETLRRTLTLARERQVDAFVIAGDLFEDHQVEETLIRETMELFAAAAPLPIIILPGNHDPFTGPGGLWSRGAFVAVPAHVHVCGTPGTLEIGPATFVTAPLRQKRSPQDPTTGLIALARSVEAGRFKIGIAHGSPAVPGQHQADEFPIALDAASRAGLDYLALGHWHGWRAEFDGGRMVMPGTPEPDRFDQPNAGHLAFVRLTTPGAVPEVEKIPVATLHWRALEITCTESEATRATITATLAEHLPQADHSLLRLRLNGTPSREMLAELLPWLAEQTAPFLAARVVNECAPRLSAAELALLQERHPLIAGLLADLDRLEGLALGQPQEIPDAQHFTLDDTRELLALAQTDPNQLTSADFQAARQLVLQSLREVAA